MSPTLKLRGLPLAGTVGCDRHRELCRGPRLSCEQREHGGRGGNTPIASGLTEQSGAPSAWWTSFGDAELDSLVARAAQ